jgi:O-antigen ligase
MGAMPEIPFPEALAMFADGACGLIGVLFLFHSWRTRSWGWTKDPVIRALLIAWAWMICIASPFAHDVPESFKVAIPWLRWVTLYAALTTWLLVSRGNLRLCALNIAGMLVFAMVDTVWQYHFGVSLTGHEVHESYRLTGPMDNVKVGIFISRLSFPAAAILLFQSMQARNLRASWAALAFLCAAIIVVVLSGERTATFSCLLGIGLFCVMLAAAEPALRMKSLIALGVAALVVILLFATQPALQGRLAFLVTNLSDFRQSAYGQLFWVGYRLGIDNWLTGVGFKGFRELCLPFLDTGEVIQCNLHPHNHYIEWFAELGLPGLALYLLAVLLLFRSAIQVFRANRGAARTLAALVIATLAMYFFPLLATQSFFSNWPALLLWYSISIAMASLNMVKWHSTITPAQ